MLPTIRIMELGTLLSRMSQMHRLYLPTGSIVLAALATILLLGKSLWRRKNLPPGPFAWPIVGNLFSLGRFPYKVVREFSLKDGAGLVYLRLGFVPYVVVNSAAMAKEVAIHNDLQFANRSKTLFSKILLNEKEIVSDSYAPSWRHLRMICTSQLFTKKRLASYESGRAQEIHTLIKSIRDDESSAGVNLSFLLRNTAINIISRMVCNKRVVVEGEGRNSEDARQYRNTIDILFETFAAFVISDFFPSLGFVTKWQGTREKMQPIADTIHAKVDEILDLQGREERRRLTPDQQTNRENDFVDLLLATPAHDGNGNLDHETVRDVVLDMLFAGADTQSKTVEWAMAHLIRHREAMHRVQSEIDAVVGTERVVSEADLEHLPFLEAVVKEVLRVQAVAPVGVPHESREETVVAGYHLPAGTRLIFNIYAIHRDPAVYDRPDEFIPERFLRGGEKHHEGIFQLMPFGAGRRICPGMSLANINLCHILAHLLHSFDWTLPGDANSSDLDMADRFDGFTASRAHPLLVVAHPRNPASLY